MASAIRIRPAEERDTPVLADFNLALASETEDRALDRPVVERGVRTLRSRPEDGFYLVAERDGQVVGSLMVTREWSDWSAAFYWWIQSVYVRPSFRRGGIYRALYERVKTLASERADVCGLRLYVERNNEAARMTYEALGMREAPYAVYEARPDGPCPSTD